MKDHSCKYQLHRNWHHHFKGLDLNTDLWSLSVSKNWEPCIIISCQNHSCPKCVCEKKSNQNWLAMTIDIIQYLTGRHIREKRYIYELHTISTLTSHQVISKIIWLINAETVVYFPSFHIRNSTEISTTEKVAKMLHG